MWLFAPGTVAAADCDEDIKTEDDDSWHSADVFMVIVQRYGVLEPRWSTSEGDFASCYDILTTNNHVKMGKAPYLTRSLTFELLSVLYWLSEFENTESQNYRRKTDVATILSEREVRKGNDIITTSDSKEPKVPYEGVVERDEKGYLHCGPYLLNQNCKHQVGTKIVVDRLVHNTDNSTKDIYQFYVKFQHRLYDIWPNKVD